MTKASRNVVNKKNGKSNGRLPKRRRVEAKHSTSKNSKKPHLPRPKSPLKFTLSRDLISGQRSTPIASRPQQLSDAKAKGVGLRSSTPINSATEFDTEPLLVRLSRINILLTAINRRNKNQHRNQPFYRHFSNLRRSLNKLTSVHEESAALSPLAAAPTSIATAAETRQRLEKASHLHSQSETLEEYIRETIVPSAYVAFSALVADSQFANLGLVLLGLLTDVVGTVGLMRTTEEHKQVNTKRKVVGMKGVGGSGIGGRLVGLSTLMTGPDQGTVVERVYDSDGGGTNEVEDRGKGTETSTDKKDHDVALDMGEVIQRDEDSKTEVTTESKSLSEQLMFQQIEHHDEGAEQGTNLTQRDKWEDSKRSSRKGAGSNESEDLTDKYPHHTSTTSENQSTRENETANMQTKTGILEILHKRNSKVESKENKNKNEGQPALSQSTSTRSSLQSTKAMATVRSSESPLSAMTKEKNSKETSVDNLTTTITTTTSKRALQPTTGSATMNKANDNYQEKGRGEQKYKNRGKGKDKECESRKKKSKKNAIDDLFSGFG